MGNEQGVVDFNDVQKAAAEGSHLICDVRGPDEFAAGHIPKAGNVPLGELAAALQMDAPQFKEKYNVDKPGKDDPIISSCKVGGRAAKGRDIFKEAGYTHVLLYQGSFMDWTNNGGEVEK